MDRIASFTINHLDLMPGLYVSRRDAKGDCVTTTFDLRITAPNREPGCGILRHFIRLSIWQQLIFVTVRRRMT